MKIVSRALPLKISLFIALLLAQAAPALALSPPWYLLQAQVKATIGNDPNVQVDDLVQTSASSYDLNIRVTDPLKAQALAAFMTQLRNFGGTTVQIRVLDASGNVVPQIPIPSNPADAAALAYKALASNHFFVKINPASAIADFSLEFKKAVVQYYADNIGDFYLNNNEVAAAAFADVLQLSAITAVRIGVSTSPHSPHSEHPGKPGA